MNNFTILIFRNKTFLEVLNQIKLFSKFKIKHFEDLDLCINHAQQENQLTIFFANTLNKDFFNTIKIKSFPLILLSESQTLPKDFHGELREKLIMPFTILNFEKKVISLIAKCEYKKNSLINLGNYIINKNERIMKKNNLELQLSEKEVNFLILFCDTSNPINRNDVLKNVWNYSIESETHTLETHIHRLRKKILEKFGDNNFIKNNKKGYYI